MAPGSDFGSWAVESLETHTNRRFGSYRKTSCVMVMPHLHIDT